jgi:CheY-like chemotaxis protein
MTGLDLVELLRALGARIPVLLVTGDPSPEIAGLAKRPGVERIVEKPARATVARFHSDQKLNVSWPMRGSSRHTPAIATKTVIISVAAFPVSVRYSRPIAFGQ